MGSYGLTIPLTGVPLHAQRELIEPRLFLYYSEDGGLAMSFSKPVATDAPRTWR